VAIRHQLRRKHTLMLFRAALLKPALTARNPTGYLCFARGMRP
jgi:hypothetical protein